MFDRKTYFDLVRQDPFDGALNQSQVTGQSALLFAWEIRRTSEDLRHFAYMLATAFHETDAKMWPIEEYGKGEGRDYGVPDPETGQTYYGRGFVQLTWRENYRRAAKELGLVGTPGDLERHAWRALDIIIAALVMFRGMHAGWFTGKELNDYFNEARDDPVGARYIINAQDKAETIAGYHKAFLRALEASWRPDEAQPVPMPPPEPEPVPVPSQAVTITIRVEGPGPIIVD